MTLHSTSPLTQSLTHSRPPASLTDGITGAWISDGVSSLLCTRQPRHTHTHTHTVSAGAPALLLQSYSTCLLRAPLAPHRTAAPRASCHSNTHARTHAPRVCLSVCVVLCSSVKPAAPLSAHLDVSACSLSATVHPLATPRTHAPVCVHLSPGVQSPALSLITRHYPPTHSLSHSFTPRAIVAIIIVTHTRLSALFPGLPG